MRKKKRRQHPIRDGTIATVLGGVVIVYIVPSFRDFVARAGSEIAKWPGIIWNALLTSYELAGWAIVIGGLCTLLVLGTVVIVLVEALRGQGASSSLYRSYIEDYIDGVKWRWSWNSDNIGDPVAFCPTCDANLVYSEAGTYWSGFVTRFICERCAPRNRQEDRCIVATIRGDFDFAISSIRREISRRVRTGKYPTRVGADAP